MTKRQIKAANKRAGRMVRDSDGYWRCVVCDGTGILPGESPPRRHDCPNCKGAGYLLPTQYRSTSYYHMR